LEKETCRTILAAEVDAFLDGLRERYAALGIDQEPVAFVKNDRGTYGLGIMTVRSGSELLELSNRKMKRLMYAKGGADVENFLVQEGVPTSMTAGSGVAEPVVYLVDGEAASWFYRANEKKGAMENLNSPSSSFLSAAEVGPEAVHLARGRHALVAELSMLAMGAERLASARRT
jgi:glutamate--cysteine ligase